MFGEVTIKNVPSDETVLFAEKVDIIERSLIGIPTTQRVKCVITNVGVYIKVANVLIDLTGTLRITPDDISSVVQDRHTLKFIDKHNAKRQTVLRFSKTQRPLALEALKSANFPID